MKRTYPKNPASRCSNKYKGRSISKMYSFSCSYMYGGYILHQKRSSLTIVNSGDKGSNTLCIRHPGVYIYWPVWPHHYASAIAAGLRILQTDYTMIVINLWIAEIYTRFRQIYQNDHYKKGPHLNKWIWNREKRTNNIHGEVLSAGVLQRGP